MNVLIGYLNDLWKYEVRNNTWTWVSGNNKANHRGVYGEMGNASSDYFPSSRREAVGWFDISTNEMWLFGGNGYGSVDSIGVFLQLLTITTIHSPVTT